ncbi:putrescine ABC transporter permease [Tistrella bauzanensis]|uniref:Putrescine ABC transporter permease n=1 Tax=Tistrella bauzanensis TaxID=657419 RepID=A0ABQ1IHE1_9PROT|nr:ABC transporter permease subunit [Tistrella bauzanensis]GGB38060.1 putrescine ABC transporter permease [Tistrella bauzanensis]
MADLETPIDPAAEPDGARRRFRLPRPGRGLVVAVPYVWLLLFFLLPFVIILKISLSQAVIGQPPYTPLLEWVDDLSLAINLNFGNFAFLFEDALYLNAYLNSMELAAISTAVALLLGYPLAYAIARSDQKVRPLLLLLIVLPFWTSFLIRVYAWIGLLQSNGLINNALMWAGVISEPLPLINNNFAVVIGIVYSYLPFMVLPLYATLEKMDMSLLEAAADLGCRPVKAFFTITLPLSMPGVIAGAMLVFIPAMGEFVIPDLLGGPDTVMIGRVLWNEFFQNRDWPVASAVAIAMLLLLVVPIMIFQNVQARSAERG